MKKIKSLLSIFLFIILNSCSGPLTGVLDQRANSGPLTGEAEILQSWQGEYPISQLDLLPEEQRDYGVGYQKDIMKTDC